MKNILCTTIFSLTNALIKQNVLAVEIIPNLFSSKVSRSKEAEYLINLGAKDFQKINENTWKVIW